jgi:hypothetical protein
MPLTDLSLYRTSGVTDLTPLKGMPLEHLNLGHLPVTDLSLLKDMTALHTLIFNDTQVTDLSMLKGLPLKTLRMRRTKVVDLAPLRGLPLENLTLDFRAERDTELLRSLTSLKQINDLPAGEFWKAQEK